MTEKKLELTAEDIQRLLKHEYGGATYFEQPSIDPNQELIDDLRTLESALLKIVEIDPVVYDGELAQTYRDIARHALDSLKGGL